jgi:hypothetical protein
MNTIEVHSFYFAEETGNLKGVRPNSFDIVTISGPFNKYSKQEQILFRENLKIYLPADKIETSSFLMERTINTLNKLSKL